MPLNATVARVTERIVDRSAPLRRPYLDRMAQAREEGVSRAHLTCGNQAHAYAAMPDADKATLVRESAGNLGIVTAYNDMLSAHQPFETYPELIRRAAREVGGTAQVAGGVPAMCDGVTQGQAGMELSLFSRDVIAMAAGIALCHNVFDATVYLGVCDKIVPGLVIAAATFGHLPAVFLPAGPMTSGITNDAKSKVRMQFATGEVGRDKLMEAEMASYHGPGTCTFYGTANTNQMLMEFMGLHLPGASFVNPGTPLREALTIEGAKRALAISALGNEYTPVADVLDERAFVNGVVGLNATGGSTNLLIHLIAMARAAGILLDWEDFAELSDVTPADGAGLPQRPRGREPLPRRRGLRLHDRRAARRRPAAPRHPHRGRRRARPLHPGAEGDRRRPDLGRGRRRQPQRQDPAPGRATRSRRPAAPGGSPATSAPG